MKLTYSHQQLRSFIFMTFFICIFLNLNAQFFFYNNSNQGAIPDNNTFSCLIRTFNVPDNFQVSDAYISVNIAHTFRQDLSLTLTSPDNTSIILMQGEGGSLNNLNLGFYDFSRELITDETSTQGSSDQPLNPLYFYSAVPETSMATFINESSAGIWTLEICDTAADDFGTFNEAELVLYNGDNGSGDPIASGCSSALSSLVWTDVGYPTDNTNPPAYNNVDGSTINIDVQVLNPTNSNLTFLELSTFYGAIGGLHGSAELLDISVDPPSGVGTSPVTFEADFTQLVSDVRTTVGDIDASFADRPSGRIDRITAIGYNGTTQVIPTMVEFNEARTTHTISGNVVTSTPFDNSAFNASGPDRATVDIYFPAPIDRFEIIYEEHSGNLDPAIRGIGIGDIDFCPMPVVPVEIGSFNLRRKEENVELHWATLSETNNDYFEIEYSEDGKFFTKIGKVSGSGTTYEQKTYHFIHRRAITENKHVLYYRLKQFDYNGEFAYSTIKSIQIDSDNYNYRISPNPIKKNEVLTVLSTNKVELYSSAGLLLRSIIANTDGSRVNLTMFNYPAGVYFIKVDGQEMQRLMVID